MASTVARRLGIRHPMSLDIGPLRPAKANVNPVDIDWRHAIGGAIARAVAMAGLSHKEAAAKVGADEAEFSRWLSGVRRPQMDKLFAVEELREPLIVALAGLDPLTFTVRTTIESKRRTA